MVDHGRQGTITALRTRWQRYRKRVTAAVATTVGTTPTAAVDRTPPAAGRTQPHDYYLVIDFEATCEEGRAFDYPNEIIEFPAILLDGSDLSEVRNGHGRG